MWQVLPDHNPESEEQMFKDVEGLILVDSDDNTCWIVKDGFREEYEGVINSTFRISHRNILKIPIRFR